MRFNHRSPYHWLVVVLVALIALFTFGPARGQGAEVAQRQQSEVAAPKPDPVAREVRSPARTVKKATRRTLERSRTGVGGIDSRADGRR